MTLCRIACLDELGHEQVETQLLVAAIEPMELEDGAVRAAAAEESWSEQLHWELLFAKQLPAAAVHRLMVACVGKAVEGGVGRLREELGVSTEGFSGQSSQEQLRQLLLVAVQCTAHTSMGAWMSIAPPVQHQEAR